MPPAGLRRDAAGLERGAFGLGPLDRQLARRSGRIEAGIEAPTVTGPSAGTPIAYCSA